MKNLLFILCILPVLNESCSKKNHAIITAPATTSLMEYPIDLTFAIDATCSIFIDSNSYFYPDEKDFNFFARSDSSLPNDSSGSYINIVQTYFDYNQSYSTPLIIITANGNKGANYFGIIPDSSGFNFFTLPYQNGFASFSGACQVAPAPASAKYHTISSRKTQPLTFSGFFDVLHHTGNIRINGSVYLAKTE